MCSSCHGDAGGLTIDHSSAQSLYDSLVGVAGASGIDLVTSGDSASSWLWIRLKALHGEPPMPLRRPERRDAGACRPMDRRRLTRCLPFIRLNEPARRSS